MEDSLSIEDEINNNLIKKPKRITLATMPRTNSLNPSNKRPDYLRDIIAKKEEKQRKRIETSKNEKDNENKDNIIEDIKNKEQKWEETLKSNKGTMMENIDDVKEKINSE